MKTQKQDFLDQIEIFLSKKVSPKVRKGCEDLEKLLKKDIQLGNGKKLLAYDPDSPFSYITAFLRDKSVAAVHPSSKYLVDRVIKAMALDKAKIVVEYGAAEGVMTQRILAKLPPDGVLVAVEYNAHFIQALSKMHDSRLRVVHGDVQEIDAIMRAQGLESADVIVSGIPFSFFDAERRKALVRKTHGRLHPGGRFVAYQFTTHLIPVLKRQFRKLHTELEVRNLPPHFVFTAHK